MKHAITNKTHITKANRSIATLLLLCQLLTSCSFNETILPNPQPQAPIHSTAEELLTTPHKSQSHSSTVNDNNFEIHTTTIEGSHLVFTYDGSEKQSLRGAAGAEATVRQAWRITRRCKSSIQAGRPEGLAEHKVSPVRLPLKEVCSKSASR